MASPSMSTSAAAVSASSHRSGSGVRAGPLLWEDHEELLLLLFWVTSSRPMLRVWRNTKVKLPDSWLYFLPRGAVCTAGRGGERRHNEEVCFFFSLRKNTQQP